MKENALLRQVVQDVLDAQQTEGNHLTVPQVTTFFKVGHALFPFHESAQRVSMQEIYGSKTWRELKMMLGLPSFSIETQLEQFGRFHNRRNLWKIAEHTQWQKKDLEHFDCNEFLLFLTHPSNDQRSAVQDPSPYYPFPSVSVSTNLYLKSEFNAALTQPAHSKVLTAVSEGADIALYALSHLALGLSPQRSMALSVLQHLSEPVLRGTFPSPSQYQKAFLLTSILYGLSVILPYNPTPATLVGIIILPCVWAYFQSRQDSGSRVPQVPEHPAYSAAWYGMSVAGFYIVQYGLLHLANGSTKAPSSSIFCDTQKPEMQPLCQAPCNVLTKTYHQLAKQHHPDRRGNDETMAGLNGLYKVKQQICKSRK